MKGQQDFGADLDRLRQSVSDTKKGLLRKRINKDRDWRRLTKNFGLDYGGIKFESEGRKRHDHGDGFSSMNGVVKFADGTIVYAIIDVCHEDSGEHYGCLFFVPHNGGQVVEQKHLLIATGKSKDDVYPYKYKYTGQPLSNDHHVGPDGWSL